MEWPRCRSTRPRCRKATSKGSARLVLQLFFGEKRGRFFGQPIEEMASLPETAWIGLRAEDDKGDLIVALRQSKQGGETIARFADEAGLSSDDIHSFHDQAVGAVDVDLPAVRVDGIRRRLHDRRDAFIRGSKRDQAGEVVRR